jgi:UMF1 family MFS transporter
MLPMTEVATTTKFQIAAGMFLVFALPCMLLVRDHRTPRPGSSAVAIRAAASSLRTTLRALPKHRALLWFLLANFCFVDVLNTAILYFADLTESLFADSAPDNLLIIAALMLNGLAMVFGISLGPWTDRRPLQVMAASGIALLLAMIGGTVFGGYSVTGFLLTLVTFGAFGLAGIWTAGRKLVLLLAPDGRTGEYFGLYGITMKLSMFGAVIYSVVADGYGTKAALLSQTPQLCLGLALLSMVRLPKRPASETA